MDNRTPTHISAARTLFTDMDMTDRNTHNRGFAAGPVGPVATVPGEFISSAIFEMVQGACRLGDKVARKLRRS